MSIQLQSWPKCVGQSAFFPNCCNIRSLPLPPRCNVGRLVGKPFLTNNIAWGEGEEGSIWPKERLFECEKLIDGRGSAFCKLVPHNFGQDCSFMVDHQSWPTSILWACWHELILTNFLLQAKLNGLTQMAIHCDHEVQAWCMEIQMIISVTQRCG